MFTFTFIRKISNKYICIKTRSEELFQEQYLNGNEGAALIEKTRSTMLLDSFENNPTTHILDIYDENTGKYYFTGLAIIAV